MLTYLLALLVAGSVHADDVPSQEQCQAALRKAGMTDPKCDDYELQKASAHPNLGACVQFAQERIGGDVELTCSYPRVLDLVVDPTFRECGAGVTGLMPNEAPEIGPWTCMFEDVRHTFKDPKFASCISAEVRDLPDESGVICGSLVAHGVSVQDFLQCDKNLNGIVSPGSRDMGCTQPGVVAKTKNLESLRQCLVDNDFKVETCTSISLGDERKEADRLLSPGAWDRHSRCAAAFFAAGASENTIHNQCRKVFDSKAALDTREVYSCLVDVKQAGLNLDRGFNAEYCLNGGRAACLSALTHLEKPLNGNSAHQACTEQGLNDCAGGLVLTPIDEETAFRRCYLHPEIESVQAFNLRMSHSRAPSVAPTSLEMPVWDNDAKRPEPALGSSSEAKSQGSRSGEAR